MRQGSPDAGATGETDAAAWVSQVARYYERNTRRFLFLGRTGGTYAMHRELWAPGVTSVEAAAGHVNRLIGDEVALRVSGNDPVLVDFGCGVGGTLFDLGRRFPEARLHGVTISPRQAEIAERLAGRLGMGDRCSFTLGDFHETDLGVQAEAVVAIESFAHSHSAEAFLANASRHLRPGGSLLVADDFLAMDADLLDARARRLVEQFRSGWRVPAVGTVESLVASGTKHGLELERVEELTDLTRPGVRTRDVLVAAVGPTLARLRLGGIPFFGNIIGGNALQIGLREGFIRYRLVILRRIA